MAVGLNFGLRCGSVLWETWGMASVWRNQSGNTWSEAVFEQTFAPTSTHALDSVHPAVENDWAILSSYASPLPLLYPSSTALSPPSAFALLWQLWMTSIVLNTLRPPRQPSSLFLSQSSPWTSSSSVCPQIQGRHILYTPHYCCLFHLHIFSPRGDAGSVGANREWPGSSSS